MFSQDDDENTRVALFAVFGVIALAVALAIGVAIFSANKTKKAAGAQAAMSAVVAVSAPVAAASGAADADGARVVNEGGVVKFFFASGKTELAPGAKEALVDALKAAQSGKKAIVSGYADATGDAAKNAEVSKQRAFAVRDALLAMGVQADKIELRKPAATTANAAGSSADARRVDVTME